MYYYGPPLMTGQKQDDQLEPTFSSYVKMGNVAMNDREKGERGSGISVLAARHDDDDDVTLVSLKIEFGWLVVWVLTHIKLCRLLNAKFILWK